MVQLEVYDAGPSVSVEPDANVEVIFSFYYCTAYIHTARNMSLY